MNYYVYTYLDPRKPGRYSYKTMSFLYEPIYIGKGKDKRYLAHLRFLHKKGKGYNPYFKNKLQRIMSKYSKDIKKYILILNNNLKEQEAFDVEKELIREIGRKDLKLGPLVNLTDGGDGISGVVVSTETREKMSKNHANVIGDKNPMFGKSRSHEKNGMFNKKHSRKTKEKMSENHADFKGPNHPMFGKHLSEETKQKIAKAHLGKSSNVKLNKTQVHQIHMLIKLKFKIKDISEVYKVHIETIRAIKKGTSWTNIYNIFNGKEKLKCI